MTELLPPSRRRDRLAPDPASADASAGGNGAGGAWREEARRLLAGLAGPPVRPYSTSDFGRERDDRCLSAILPERQAETLLPGLRGRLPAGTVAFIGTKLWLGDERHEGVELVVGPGGSQFAIPRLARTDGANYDLTTEDIVARLEEYDRDHGIVITRATADAVEFNLRRTPPDLAAFAADLYAFCPDIVDQGSGSVEALAEGIEIVGAVFLWWD